MKGKSKKYISDFAVGLCSARWVMISASELLSGKSFSEEQTVSKEVINKSHIYVITKIPKFYYIKNSVSYKNGILSATVGYKINGEEKFIKEEGNFSLDYGATKLEVSEYPHREIITYDDKNNDKYHLPASSIGINAGRCYRNKDIVDLEVLYIGQAYGDGSRNTFDRLKSHSTLQKILADCSNNYPDDEVYILSFEYMPYQLFTIMDGKANVETTAEEDSQRFYSILQNPLSERQQVCLVEAGLIRYFKPKYNIVYKDNFPSSNSKILEECYKLDFSGLVVEINTEELDFYLYSDSVARNYHHIANINLLKHEDRYGFFHFTLDKDNQTVFTLHNLIE